MQCVFAILFTFYPVYVFHYLQLLFLFVITSHQVPRGGRVGDGESPKHNRKKKWKVWGREYLVLCCLSPSNKLSFALVLCLCSHLKHWYLLPRWTEFENTRRAGSRIRLRSSWKEDTFEKQLQHIILLKHVKERGCSERLSSNKEETECCKNMFTACLVLLKILPVLQPLCSPEC